MTPEERAAIERLRRFAEMGAAEFVDPHYGWLQREYVLCLEHAARLALAEHPADDDEPVTWREVEEALSPKLAAVNVMEGVGVIAYVSNYVPMKTRRQLRQLLEVLGR